MLLQPGRFSTITCPTLVVWGENDIALGKELLQGMSPKYVTDVTVKLIPGASHWVQCDVPDAVNETVAAFLKTV